MLNAANQQLPWVSEVSKENLQFNVKTKEKEKKVKIESSSHCSQTSTATKEIVNTNPNLLSLVSTQISHQKTNALAIELNRLKKKYETYTSHKDCLSQCINIKLVPKDLELAFELTTGNYDQSFIDTLLVLQTKSFFFEFNGICSIPLF